jgi:hypothetical protein
MNTPQELKEQYYMLYDYMAQSRDPKNMKAFGKVMTEMMEAMLEKMPAEAQEMIQKLEAIRWNQYLTPKEAEAIVAKMNPAAPWKRDVWNKAMADLGIPTEEAPCYNSCALWTEMNKQYSDHAATIAERFLKKPLESIPAEEIVPGIYGLAIDALKDKDGVYNIRSYFGL